MYNNAPIRNNTLLQEAYNAGYYRALNEALGGGGMGAITTAAYRGVNNIAGGGQQAQAQDGPSTSDMPKPPKEGDIYTDADGVRWVYSGNAADGWSIVGPFPH